MGTKKKLPGPVDSREFEPDTNADLHDEEVRAALAAELKPAGVIGVRMDEHKTSFERKGVRMKPVRRMPVVGDVVLYRLPKDFPGLLAQSLGEQRPATVVRVLDDEHVNLMITLDGANDTAAGATHAHGTAVEFGERGGQWCWQGWTAKSPF